MKNRENGAKYVSIWLCASLICVLIMVFIGGITRLTNSGLSIVEWKPITGVIPPLSALAWEEEFQKYQSSPEFKILNNHMDLKGFKSIFWLEYIHRLFGRITGLVFFIPLILFWIKNKLDTRIKKIATIVSVIGLFQGFMGWYMVKSGLLSSPHVSHFRLATHLLIALIIFTLLLDGFLYCWNKNNFSFKISFFTAFCIFITFLQIFLGGLVAGLDAGLVYQQFPKMGSSLAPSELYSTTISQFLFDPSIVQFIHRVIAVFLTILITILAYRIIRKSHRKTGLLLLLILTIQFSLGVITLLSSVRIEFASAHQIFAFILSGYLVFIARRIDGT